MEFETLCLHADENKKDEWGTITAPVCQASTFVHKGVGIQSEFTYSRLTNPTRSHLENTVAKLEELKAYLAGNIEFAKQYISVNMPNIKFLPPEGTYLVWLDCKCSGLSDSELENLIVNKAGLWLDDGYIFGKGGSGFERINIACPRSTLKEALDRLKNALC